MTWKLLGEGHGHGYVEYYDGDYAHGDYPQEIPDDVIDYMENDSCLVDTWQDSKYIYVIHHVHDETYNYFRYTKE